MGARWAPGVVAALLAVSGLAVFLQLRTPENVSAAQVLHRARLALVNAHRSEVIHEVSMVRVIPNPHGPTVGVPWLGDTPDGRLVPTVIEDSWTQLADDHTIARLDTTAEDSSGRIRFHVVGRGTRGMAYDAADGSVVVFPWRRPAVFLDSRPYGVGLPTNLPIPAAVVQELLQGKQPQLAAGDVAHFLGRQSFQGVTVDVVQVVHRVPYDTGIGTPAWRQIFTYYVDTGDYVVRRSVVRTVDARDRILGMSITRLIRHERIPVSHVPVGVFTFTAPPGTCLYTELPYKLPDSNSPACLPKHRPVTIVQ